MYIQHGGNSLKTSAFTSVDHLPITWRLSRWQWAVCDARVGGWRQGAGYRIFGFRGRNVSNWESPRSGNCANDNSYLLRYWGRRSGNSATSWHLEDHYYDGHNWNYQQKNDRTSCKYCVGIIWFYNQNIISYCYRRITPIRRSYRRSSYPCRRSSYPKKFIDLHSSSLKL